MCTIPLIGILIVAYNAVTTLVSVLKRILAVAARIFPTVFGYQFLFVARAVQESEPAYSATTSSAGSRIPA